MAQDNRRFITPQELDFLNSLGLQQSPEAFMNKRNVPSFQSEQTPLFLDPNKRMYQYLREKYPQGFSFSKQIPIWDELPYQDRDYLRAQIIEDAKQHFH